MPRTCEVWGFWLPRQLEQLDYSSVVRSHRLTHTMVLNSVDALSFAILHVPQIHRVGGNSVILISENCTIHFERLAQKCCTSLALGSQSDMASWM